MVFLRFSRIFWVMALLASSSAAFAATDLTQAAVDNLRSKAQTALIEGRDQAALNYINQVVLARPADLSVRFFRAQILTSMGRGEEVRGDLELIASLNLPAAEIAKAESLLAAINKHGQRHALNAVVKAAIGSTNNINAWPDGGERTSGGANFPLPDPVNEAFEAISDETAEISFALNGTYDLNEARDLQASYNASVLNRDGLNTLNADNKYWSVGGGIEKTLAGDTKIKAALLASSFDRVNRDDDDDDVNTDIGTLMLSLEASMRLDDVSRGGYRFSRTENDHSGLATADWSDSIVDSHRVYLGRYLDKTTYARLSLSLAQAKSDNSNDTPSNVLDSRERVNKDTTSASLLLVKVLPNKQRLIGSMSYSQGQYDLQEVDADIKRKDNTASVSLGYSIKGERFSQRLEGFDFGVNVSYIKTRSNQASARVSATQYIFSISKRFQM